VKAIEENIEEVRAKRQNIELCGLAGLLERTEFQMVYAARLIALRNNVI
jgi:hypothetical protein